MSQAYQISASFYPRLCFACPSPAYLRGAALANAAGAAAGPELRHPQRILAAGGGGKRCALWSLKTLHSLCILRNAEFGRNAEFLKCLNSGRVSGCSKASVFVPVLFPLRRRCSACSGLLGKQHLWFVVNPKLVRVFGCRLRPKIAESSNTPRQAARGRRKPLPRKKPLNETSGKNRFAISNTVITDFDIFYLRFLCLFAPPLFPK